MDTTTTPTTEALLSQVNLMVTRFAKRLAAQSGGSVDAADLAQVGLMAALRCATTFDASKGAAFRTYCWHPVMEEMKRAKNASRSVTGGVTRCAAMDVSFSAPVSAHAEDNDETFGDLMPSEEESAEVQAMKAQRETKVREIVARVRAEWKDAALFDELLARLMDSYFGGEGLRVRSTTSFSEIAERHGCSRQNVDAREKRLYRELTRALAVVARES